MLAARLKVPDIMARFGVTAPTARRYMRQMQHTEKPLTVSEDALLAWEWSKTCEPMQKVATSKRMRKAPPTDMRIPRKRA